MVDWLDEIEARAVRLDQDTSNLSAEYPDEADGENSATCDLWQLVEKDVPRLIAEVRRATRRAADYAERCGNVLSEST